MNHVALLCTKRLDSPMNESRRFWERLATSFVAMLWSAIRPQVSLHSLVVLVEAVVEVNAVLFSEKHLALFFDPDGQVIVVADGNGVRFFEWFVEQPVIPLDLLVVHLDDHLPEQLAEPEFDQVFLVPSDFQAEFHKTGS
jgi:hypothetical protein